MFIVVHQAYELWFKLMLHELVAARDELADGRPHVAAPRLRRVVAVERLLLEQLGVLETMGTRGLPRVPRPARAGLGLPVAPVREISGSRGARHVARWRHPPAGASLYEAFAPASGCREDRDERVAALAALYRDHAGDPLRAAWHEVAELLVDHDEGVARWRHHHALMAAREIGTRPGTGGSPGVEYLKRTVDRRFFPDLWDVRLAL